MRPSTQVWIATIPAVVLSGVGVFHLIKWVKSRNKIVPAPAPAAAPVPAAAPLQAPPPAAAQAPSRTAALAEEGAPPAAVRPPSRGGDSGGSRRRVKFKKPQLKVIKGGAR